MADDNYDEHDQGQEITGDDHFVEIAENDRYDGSTGGQRSPADLDELITTEWSQSRARPGHMMTEKDRELLLKAQFDEVRMKSRPRPRNPQDHWKHWRPWPKDGPRHWVYDPDQYLEDSAGEVLKLGEFMEVPSLTYSEARLVINAITKSRTERRVAIGYSDVQRATMDEAYKMADVFGNYKAREHVQAAENLLSRYKNEYNLHHFERAQLGSLGFETAEEAKAVVPSLANKIADDDLQPLLDELEKLRKEGMYIV